MAKIGHAKEIYEARRVSQGYQNLDWLEIV